MFSVGSVDTATAGNEFGVVFTSYQSAFIQLFFASITVSVSSGVPVSITLSPSSGAGASLSGSNFFSVSYTLGGVAETADQTGGTLNLNVDPSTDVNVSAMSSGSGPSEQWCLYLCSPVNFSSGASGASETYVYYQQFLEQVSYSTSGGAPPSNWCGGGICEEFLFYPSAGLPLSVPLLLTPTSVFMDAEDLGRGSAGLQPEFRYGGRHHLVIMGGLGRNQQHSAELDIKCVFLSKSHNERKFRFLASRSPVPR